MAAVFLSVFLLLLSSSSLLPPALCGEVTITHSPPPLRFGLAGPLRTTDLDDVLAAGLGYTPVQPSPWRGLTITTPFASPSAAVVLAVRGGGASVRLEGATYTLREDGSIEEVYKRLRSIYGAKAMRTTAFKHISVLGNNNNNSNNNNNNKKQIPEVKFLNSSKEPDAEFLKEMMMITTAAKSLEGMSTRAHGGQDVFFLHVHTLEDLVTVYGTESKQVNEAIRILRGQVVAVTQMMREGYQEDVLVVCVVVDDAQTHTRHSRSILQYSRTTTTTTTTDLNISPIYSQDFPVIFNIILWLSLTLSLAVFAVAVSMASMDPGRDSIIYRMTTMRMKKEN